MQTLELAKDLASEGGMGWAGIDTRGPLELKDMELVLRGVVFSSHHPN